MAGAGFLLRADGDRGAEADRAVAPGATVDLGELVLGAGEADFQALDFAEPAFALGFGDAGQEVVADLGDAGPLGGLRPVHAASQTAMLVNAGRAECAPAYYGRDFPALEMPEEFLPFLFAGDAVFFAGPLCPPPGEERQVGLDGLLRINGLVAHSRVDILVACDDLRDMRRQAVHDGIRDKDSPEIVRCVAQGEAVGGVGQAGAGQRGIEHAPQVPVADGPVLSGEPPLEQDRRRRPPYAFAPVVGGDQRDCPAGLADPLDDGRQYVRQLRGYDQKSLLICLGRDDLQQGDDLAGGRQPVLDQAVVADLQEFLDPDAREPQDFDGSPCPEGVIVFHAEVPALAAGRVVGPYLPGAGLAG